VVKDLCTYSAFIDVNSDALHQRANEIILPFALKGTTANNNNQSFTLHESVVKERVSMKQC
jgi:hypothetical protein